jgi:hypothetical protein
MGGTFIRNHDPVSTTVSYVLPLRCQQTCPDHGDLATYLLRIGRLAEVIVVDGSAPHIFREHDQLLGRNSRHIQPDDDLRCANGKVAGVITGVRASTGEHVVIADDDVRYDAAMLHGVARRLGCADLVIPQNVFQPMPWHAVWDTGRTLLNRAFGTDYPGTLAIRRSTFLRIGAYDGDVLFENLELIRTMRARGGCVEVARDLVIERRPATFAGFLRQRPRQAFDDLAQPVRALAFAALGPLCVLAGLRRRWGTLALAGAASAGVAELGRRRSRGIAFYPATASLAAPLWMLERAVCIWLAIGIRIALGGIRYHDARISRAATSIRALRTKAGA